MKHYKIITIEVENEDKSPDLKHYSVCEENIHSKQNETFANEDMEKMILEVIKEIPGRKSIKSISTISEEQYCAILKNQIVDANDHTI